MSVNYKIHIGAYLKCTISEKNYWKEATIKAKSCPNSDCFNNKNRSYTKYCDQCGSKIIELDFLSVERKFSSYPYDIFDGVERLWEARNFTKKNIFTSLYAANIKYIKRQDSYDQYDEDFCQEIPAEIIEQEKQQFSETFEYEINKLKTLFDKVEICWGIIKDTR